MPNNLLLLLLLDCYIFFKRSFELSPKASSRMSSFFNHIAGDQIFNIRYFLILISDVARPSLSYKTKITYFFKTKTGQAKTKTKTKTAFSRPRRLFLKTFKLLTQYRWRSQKF